MGALKKEFVNIHNKLKSMKDIMWIEIGVFRGDTALFALENYDIKKIYLIDPYKPLPYLHKYFGTELLVNKSKNIAYERLQKYDDKTIFLEDFSEKVCNKIDDNTCSVLFIDGNHSYESVKLDLLNYIPKMITGGVVIGDDYNEPEVKKALDWYVKDKNIHYNVEQISIDPSFKLWFTT